jgi:hypothetical protein
MEPGKPVMGRSWVPGDCQFMVPGFLFWGIPVFARFPRFFINPASIVGFFTRVFPD